MKKIIAVIVCIAVLCTLSVAAFAASPSGTPMINVIIRKADGLEGVTKVDEKTALEMTDNGVIVRIKTNSIYGNFNNWRIYKPDSSAQGYSAAVEGTDYRIIEGSLTSVALKVNVFSDVIICGNYNGTITDPLSASSQGSAPLTADMSVVCAAIVMLAAAGMVMSAKKVFSK